MKNKKTDVPPSNKYNREGVLRFIKLLRGCSYTVDVDYANNRLYYGKDYAGNRGIKLGIIHEEKRILYTKRRDE